jgi:hypothetical protein
MVYRASTRSNAVLVIAAPCAELIGATLHEARNNPARPTGTTGDNLPSVFSMKQSIGINPPNLVLSNASEMFDCTRRNTNEIKKRRR